MKIVHNTTLKVTMATRLIDNVIRYLVDHDCLDVVILISMFDSIAGISMSRLFIRLLLKAL